MDGGQASCEISRSAACLTGPDPLIQLLTIRSLLLDLEYLEQIEHSAACNSGTE